MPIIVLRRPGGTTHKNVYKAGWVPPPPWKIAFVVIKNPNGFGFIDVPYEGKVVPTEEEVKQIEAKWIEEHDNQPTITTIVDDVIHNQMNEIGITAFKPMYLKPKQEPEVKKSLSEIKITDLYKYPSLSKQSGLEGKLPVRAGTTFIGVEVELEGVNVLNVPSTWKATEDGSLKESGMEFVTVPIQFKYLEVELQRLYSGLSSFKTTKRCSVHVHINARDFTLEELKTFVALYMVFERSLYNVSGNRWNNNFCVPLQFYPDMVKDWVDTLNTHRYIPERWFKYFGFNISPLFGGESTRIGTIEFRHMKGNTHIPSIIDWINLIVSLKISAKKIPFEEVLNHIKTMNTTSGYYWLGEVVFGDFFKLILTQETFKKDVESSIAIAKLVFCNPEKCEEFIEIAR